MPGTVITTSPDIALLDSRIIASLCSGYFYVDISPSVYIGSGKTLVLGANVKIVNPYGVVVKDYGTNYEIAPALSQGMDGVVSFAIPTMASNYQYGKYTISVELFDQNNTRYVVTKTVSLCEPDKNNKTRSYGTLSATMRGSCTDGKVFIVVDTPPNYNGRIYESRSLDLTLDFPTASGEDPLETSIGSFSVQLYEGVYKLTGTDCVTYNFGDNIFVKVNYKIKLEKNIRCLIDECCVQERINELSLQLDAGCPLPDKERISNTIVEALLQLKIIELNANCGQDASDAITKLEQLLGCSCTCNCAEGTPIINTNPAKDFSIVGCGFDKTTVGLTDTYTLYNYTYVVEVVPNGGVLTVSAATLDGCTKTQTISFDIAAAYSQIKSLANETDEEAAFWASVINKILNSIGNGVITGWTAMTFLQRIESMLNYMSSCCYCGAYINGVEVDLPIVSFIRNGSDVEIQWADTGEDKVEVWLDGILKGTVDSSLDTFNLVGAADGNPHTWVLKPLCSNNKYGTPATGEFTYIGCDTVAPPTVSSNNVNGVSCPYDLTSLVSTPPLGIDVEWHTANNTNASSLVPDATNVSSGVYYAFAKNGDGCYSTATVVTLICAEATSCTAPQGLFAQPFLGAFRILFSSAAYPPPSNSYTVKRRLASDPDVDGSYTTIGTPTFNAGLNKWTILDGSANNNTLYVYKAISNCGGSPVTTPYTTYEFANITCPSVTYTPALNSIGYSFTNVGANITKYEVKLYDAAGVVLLETDTYTPAFSTPISGTFSGLSSSTTYKIRVRVYIGTYYTDCTFSTQVTTGATGNNIFWSVNDVVGARLRIYDGASPANTVLNILSTSTSQNGELTGLSGAYQVCAEWASGSGNVIKIRICDVLGNEVFYDGSITVGDPTSCYTLPALPNSSAPYYVYVTAGNIEPPSCGA